MKAFFGPEISVLGRKIRILPYNPNFGQQPVCSPRRDLSFFDFSFPSYGLFRNKTQLMRQKVFPLPRHRLPEIALAHRLPVIALALSARFARGLDKWINCSTFPLLLVCFFVGFVSYVLRLSTSHHGSLSKSNSLSFNANVANMQICISIKQ